LHYYPDALHYRECDLKTWLPELKAMGVAWLTLLAPPDRAIPEPFLQGLLQAGIEPILHFRMPCSHQYHEDTLGLLFKVYAAWGLHYVVLFDRPNQRDSWPASAWAQSDLVERFLDIFLPLANQALQAGIIPIFPPLEPGGDYWDTSFLQASLQGMQRRGQSALLEALHLGAYAWTDGTSLDWGAGGPERWPGVRPYSTPTGQQDQRGFYIFDWYIAHSQAALGAPRPVILLAAGCRFDLSANSLSSEAEELEHAASNIAIARRLGVSNPSRENEEPISPHVLACNFWLLATDPNDPMAPQAWFQPGGYHLPVVDALRQLASGEELGSQSTQSQPLPVPSWLLDEDKAPGENKPVEEPDAPAVIQEPAHSDPKPSTAHPIAHYLLLPLHESGAAEWHLEAAKPFILKHLPTVGYSPVEAALAQQVTVVGGAQIYPEALLDDLRRGGCQVTRIEGDGTEIATQLASS